MFLIDRWLVAVTIQAPSILDWLIFFGGAIALLFMWCALVALSKQ